MGAANIAGMRFGLLTVIKRTPNPSHAAYWLCQCDCGNTVPVRGANLRRGKTKSCGCLRNELSSARITKQNITHGESNTRLYSIWCDMKKRCSNANHWAYSRYGGRGIEVDPRWSDFAVFSEWAKNNGYSDDLTLDREDNDGNYCPENCRWITQKAQSRNKSNNVRFEYGGIAKTLSEWADETGIPYTTLYGRIHGRGWSVERALLTPPRKGGD